MSGLDAAAAAAAYLGRLPAGARAAAVADTAWAEGTAVALVLMLLGVSFAFLRLGVLVRIREGLALSGTGRWTADLLCAAVFTAAAALACAPFLVWRARKGFGTVLLSELRQDLTLVAAAAILAPALYLLIRRAPRLWGLALGLVLGGVVFASCWLPYVSAAGPAALPAAAGPARAGLIALIRETGLPAAQVYVSPGSALDADVTGTAARARVVITRGLWDAASPAELRAGVGHLIGHYVHRDQLAIAALLGLSILAGFGTLQTLFAPAARLLGARGVQGPGDPAGLPVLTAIATVWFAAMVVADHALIRAVNVRADQYSLDHAREPDGLAIALLREWRGDRVDPSPLQAALFYDHPPLADRLLHAMRWKADHPR